MPRRRLGVVLLLPGAAAREVDGLRRAVGSTGLGRVPPHCTLVSPVNVRDDDLGEALRLLRVAAAGADGPITLRAGPPTSFLPANPVLQLPVVGGAAACVALRDALHLPPLRRPASWPYAPHVTLAEELDPDRIAAAVALLDGAVVECVVDRVHLLERESDDGVWRPIADAVLGPATVVGRGGLPLELGVTGVADPEASAVLAAAGAPGPVARDDEPPHPRAVVTARRDGAVVGVAWADAPAASVPAVLRAVAVVPAARREGVGGHLVAALEATLRDDGVAQVVGAPDLPDAVAALLTTRGWTRSDAPSRDL